jgi:hypothetical protein
MKKFFTSILLVVVLGGSGLYAAGNMLPPSAVEIVIKETTPPASDDILSSYAVPVDAQMTNRQIDLAFLANLGAVTVTVENGQGVVFQSAFAAIDGAEAFINAENWSDGDYTITIVRSDDGKTFTGDFELEQE